MEPKPGLIDGGEFTHRAMHQFCCRHSVIRVGESTQDLIANRLDDGPTMLQRCLRKQRHARGDQALCLLIAQELV